MISVVVPVYNEEESLPFFYKELTSFLKSRKDCEIIFIDDGSTDKSLNLLKNLSKKDKSIRIFSFLKNQGKSEALTLGFQKAKGDYIVTLDADLQDKPTEISKLFNEQEKGFDLVCGFRKKRHDPFLKVLSSRIFNFASSVFWGLKLHDYNCGLKLYTKNAAKSIKLYGGLHRFIPLMVYQNGFRVTEVPVEHNERQHGKSKYGLSKLWKDSPDIFSMLFLSKYAKRPLHFFGIIGFFLLFSGTAILLYLTFLKFEGQGIGNRPILFLGMLLVLTGFQVFFTGFLADLFINTNRTNQTESLLKYSSEE